MDNIKQIISRLREFSNVDAFISSFFQPDNECQRMKHLEHKLQRLQRRLHHDRIKTSRRIDTLSEAALLNTNELNAIKQRVFKQTIKTNKVIHVKAIYL